MHFSNQTILPDGAELRKANAGAIQGFGLAQGGDRPRCVILQKQGADRLANSPPHCALNCDGCHCLSRQGRPSILRYPARRSIETSASRYYGCDLSTDLWRRGRSDVSTQLAEHQTVLIRLRVGVWAFTLCAELMSCFMCVSGLRFPVKRQWRLLAQIACSRPRVRYRLCTAAAVRADETGMRSLPAG